MSEQRKIFAAALKEGRERSGWGFSDDQASQIARRAAEWLGELGFAIVYVSRCWCEGMATGVKHTVGCPGIEQDATLRKAFGDE